MIFTLFALAIAAGLVFARGGAAAGDFADEPCASAAATTTSARPRPQGSAYAIDIKLKEPWDDCTEFSVSSGDFPPGLSVSNNGNIRGTPTAAGSHTFYVTVAGATRRRA